MLCHQRRLPFLVPSWTNSGSGVNDVTSLAFHLTNSIALHLRPLEASLVSSN